MGIEASLHQVTEEQLKMLQENERLIDEWIFYEEEDPGVLVDEGQYLGNSFYGLNEIITGDHLGGEPPASYAIFGKHILFEDDWGIHSCTYLMPGEVKEVWEVLRKITIDDLASHFDAEEMNETPVYPASGWEESDFGYLFHLFQTMLDYYHSAVERKNAMVHLIY